jgi:predicted dithiol-disulfide oxidoreductase (DUF899 family)
MKQRQGETDAAGDVLNGAYHWLDLVPQGRDESGPT